MVRDTGPVEQAGLTAGPVPVHPLRQALTGDTGLGGDVGDRAVLAASDKAQPAGRGERGVTVGHAGLFLAGTSWSHLSSCRSRPAPVSTDVPPPRHQPHEPQQLTDAKLDPPLTGYSRGPGQSSMNPADGVE